VIARLRGERDELRRTEERLHSERSTAHEDRDRAIWELDEARWVVDSLRADLGATVNRTLDAESIVARLDKELTEV